jgi:transcriptional regulator with XRE-family HTH domain
MRWFANFRRNLARAIEAREISQVELSRRSGIHVTTISRIINGHLEPTVSTAEKLAEAAELTAAKLFSEKIARLDQAEPFVETKEVGLLRRRQKPKRGKST